MAQLTISATPTTAATGPYNVSALGPLDWLVYTSNNQFVRKSGSIYLTFAQLGSYTNVGYSGGPGVSWTGGTPIASGSSTGGIYTGGGQLVAGGAGYSVTAPADTEVRTLRLWCGNYSTTIKISVTISDGSTPTQVFTSTGASLNTGGNFLVEITYAAASAGQTITVAMVVEAPSYANRNVSFTAASLTGGAPAGGGITVTGVAVTPSTATLQPGTTQQFSAAVTGNASPAQSVTWAASAGTISASGLFTPPTPTNSVQTVTITATSTQDSSKSGTATVTIPVAAIAQRTVTFTLGVGADAPAANQQGVMMAVYDEPTPDKFTTPKFQSATKTTDAAGVITATYSSQVQPGAFVGVVVQTADGKHYNGKVAVS